MAEAMRAVVAGLLFCSAIPVVTAAVVKNSGMKVD